MLLAEEHYAETTSRCFYAIYAAAKALLTAPGVQTRTHSGVKRMLGLHYVIPGLLSEQHIRSYERKPQRPT